MQASRNVISQVKISPFGTGKPLMNIMQKNMKRMLSQYSFATPWSGKVIQCSIPPIDCGTPSSRNAKKRLSIDNASRFQSRSSVSTPSQEAKGIKEKIYSERKIRKPPLMVSLGKKLSLTCRKKTLPSAFALLETINKQAAANADIRTLEFLRNRNSRNDSTNKGRKKARGVSFV